MAGLKRITDEIRKANKEKWNRTMRRVVSATESLTLRVAHASWVLTLECGHKVSRGNNTGIVPKRAKCHTCKGGV